MRLGSNQYDYTACRHTDRFQACVVIRNEPTTHFVSLILLAATTRNLVKPRSYQRYTAFVEKQVRELVLESITDSLLTTFHIAFQTRDSRLLIYALGGGALWSSVRMHN